MSRLSIGHVGLHVRDLEEEIAFLELIGGELTSVDRAPVGRVAFVSLDGERHHSLALFEDGRRLPSGDSKKEPVGVHHIALPAESIDEVKSWQSRLEAAGIEIDGPLRAGPRRWRSRWWQRQLRNLLHGSERNMLRDLCRRDDAAGVSPRRGRAGPRQVTLRGA